MSDHTQGDQQIQNTTADAQTFLILGRAFSVKEHFA